MTTTWKRLPPEANRVIANNHLDFRFAQPNRATSRLLHWKIIAS